MAVLVTGGLGYVGSHAVRQLVKRGEQVVTLDNLTVSLCLFFYTIAVAT